MLPIDPDDVVRGQYEGYRDEEGVAPDSEVETFVAARVRVDNWRWAGVPFFLRTGKCMAEGARVVSIAFREPPKSMFPAGVGRRRRRPRPPHLRPRRRRRGSRCRSTASGPGPGMQLEKASMQFSLGETARHEDVLEAYERLIHDAMTGDRTLFTTAEGVERLWEVSAPLLERSAAAAALRAGLVGAGRDRRPDRAAALAAAVRAQVAGQRLTSRRSPVRGGVRRRGPWVGLGPAVDLVGPPAADRPDEPDHADDRRACRRRRPESGAGPHRSACRPRRRCRASRSASLRRRARC